GLALIALVPVAVCVHRRRPELLAVTAAGVATVALAFTAAGFWWLDGLAAARTAYAGGLASVRPARGLLLARPAPVARLLGPARPCSPCSWGRPSSPAWAASATAGSGSWPAPPSPPCWRPT